MFFDKDNKQINYTHQSFSSTDLAKSGDVGIVFPIKEADEDTINVASIIDRNQGRVCIKHTDARLVSTDDKNVNYEKGKTITYVSRKFYNSEVDIDLLGLEPFEDLSYFVSKDIEETNDKFNKIAKFWDNLNFKPMVFIDDKNISKKEIKVTHYDWYNKYYGKDLVVKDTITKNELTEINAYVKKFLKSDSDLIVDVDKFLTFTNEEKKNYLIWIEDNLNILIDEELIVLAKTSNDWKDLYISVLEDLLLESQYSYIPQGKLW